MVKLRKCRLELEVKWVHFISVNACDFRCEVGVAHLDIMRVEEFVINMASGKVFLD